MTVKDDIKSGQLEILERLGATPDKPELWKEFLLKATALNDHKITLRHCGLYFQLDPENSAYIDLYISSLEQAIKDNCTKLVKAHRQSFEDTMIDCPKLEETFSKLLAKTDWIEEKTELLSADALDFAYTASAYITHYIKPHESRHKVTKFGHARTTKGLLEIYEGHQNNIREAGSELSQSDFDAVEELILVEFNDCEDQKRVKELVNRAMFFGKQRANLSADINQPYCANE